VEQIPPFYDFMGPVLRVLGQSGGAASNRDIVVLVARAMNLSPEQLAVERRKGGSTTTEVEYRIGWAKSYLKKLGYIVNSARAEWSLTERGRAAGTIDPRKLVKKARSRR